MISFVFDTSAFVSLESVYLLDLVLKNFQIITSPSVFSEVGDFAIHNDELGQAAQRVLEKKQKIVIEEANTAEELLFVSLTDKEVFNLALGKKITLITDDVKLARHAEMKIQTEFSTFFLSAFIASELLTKKEALQKLELMRSIRNWKDNIIYLSAKEEVNISAKEEVNNLNASFHQTQT